MDPTEVNSCRKMCMSTAAMKDVSGRCALVNVREADTSRLVNEQ